MHSSEGNVDCMHNIRCASSPQQALTADQIRTNWSGFQEVMVAFHTAEAMAASKHGQAREESKEAHDLASGQLYSERTQVKRGEGI